MALLSVLRGISSPIRVLISLMEDGPYSFRSSRINSRNLCGYMRFNVVFPLKLLSRSNWGTIRYSTLLVLPSLVEASECAFRWINSLRNSPPLSAVIISVVDETFTVRPAILLISFVGKSSGMLWAASGISASSSIPRSISRPVRWRNRHNPWRFLWSLPSAHESLSETSYRINCFLSS